MIKVPCLVNGKVIQNVFPEALYIPSSPRNILSYARLRNCGVTTVDTIPNQWVFYLSNGRKMMESTQTGNLFVVHTNQEIICLASKIDEKHYLQHCRVGHLGQFDGCDVCALTKLSRKPFPQKSETVPENVGDLIVSDVWGPFQTPSPAGSRFYVSFLDVKTRFSWIYFLKRKSDVLTKFQEFNSMLKTQLQAKIKTFRSDGGGEYCNEAFDAYLAAEGIHREKTVPHSPQQNGIAERLNRTLITIARSIRHGTGIPDSLWAEVVATANYLRNINETSATGKTPYELLYGKPPDLTRLKKFGCK
ncbi:hypothetical protein SeLEV6574_g08657, partial [Synchytrium endobioticum]